MRATTARPPATRSTAKRRASRNPQHVSTPFVLVNMAMTADGKIATANRLVSTFTSAQDHEHLLDLRATADAVMCGATTVNAAPINLGPGGSHYQKLRLARGLAQFNLRVIVSGSGAVNPGAEVFRHNISPIIVLTTRRIATARLAALRGLATVKICGERTVNFRVALRWLKRVWGVNRLLCEGGGELNDALFRAGLVDELHLTVGSRIFGGRTAPTIADGTGFGKLNHVAEFELKSIRPVEDEMFLVYRTRRDP